MAAPTVLTRAEERVLHAVDDTNEAPWMVTPEYQTLMAQLLAGSLRLYARRQQRPWYVITELGVITPKPGGATLTLGPDLLVAYARPQLEPRDSWDVRQEGHPPELVLEIVTDQSVKRDTEQKRDYYDAMGVREYVICWPRRRRGLRLFGYERTATGDWAAWEPDANSVRWSSVLDGLGFYLEGPFALRACDVTGRRLPSPEEEAERADEASAAQQAAEERAQQEVTARWAEAMARLAESNARLAAEEQARHEAAARLEAEQQARREAAARLAAEERAVRAEAELERLRRDLRRRE